MRRWKDQYSKDYTGNWPESSVWLGLWDQSMGSEVTFLWMLKLKCSNRRMFTGCFSLARLLNLQGVEYFIAEVQIWPRTLGRNSRPKLLTKHAKPRYWEELLGHNKSRGEKWKHANTSHLARARLHEWWFTRAPHPHESGPSLASLSPKQQHRCCEFDNASWAALLSFTTATTRL